MARIPVAGPWITQREIDLVAEAAAGAWYENAGAYHDRLEGDLREHFGVPHALLLPSCTSAIHLALLGAGVGPGDEVVVPELTWIATAAPVDYVGATVVFADVDPVTWCLSAEAVRACLTPRTRAVIPVDLYGGTPDLPALEALAAERGLLLVEDAAEAIGSTRNGRKAGTFGDAGVFSFHGSKTLTTGEGGLLLTRSAALFERALVLRDHGRAKGDTGFFNAEVGYKYKMSALQAALGIAQLERLEELVARKRQLFAWYAQRLGQVPGITLNAEPAGTRNSYWMVTAVFDAALGVDKARVRAHLAARGIDSRPFFHPLSSLPAYRERPQAQAARARNAVSYALSPLGVNLPSALNLSEGQVDEVCQAIRTLL